MSSTDLNIRGELEILKKFRDGSEEVVFDDHNIIVAGMGIGLSYLFAASGSPSILDYQIDRFQVGVSGTPSLEVSSTERLAGPLSSVTEYGINSNLYIQTANLIIAAGEAANQVFPLIPSHKITRIGDTSVRYTFILDEGAANDLERNSSPIYLNEVGLFMRNPTGSVNPKPILVAYRVFNSIDKTSDFSLVFRWTLHF